MSKKDNLIMLFPEIGDKKEITDVMLEAGIQTEGVIKTYCWELRRDNIIDLRIKFGWLKRVN